MAKKGQKTRRSRQHHSAMTIPELRRAFEHVESFVMSHKDESMKNLVPMFQKEWKRTFYKPLDHSQAEAYVHHVLEQTKTHTKRYAKTRRHRVHGGADPLAGAPLDYTTRAGIYISPGINEGSYALVPKYVDSGFWNPEPGRSYDPVPGQTRFPTSVPFGMGSNSVNSFPKVGGAIPNHIASMPAAPTPAGRKSRKARRLRGGVALLDKAYGMISQATMRVPMDIPPSLVNDMQTAWYGQKLGASPDPTQNDLKYKSSA